MAAASTPVNPIHLSPGTDWGTVVTYALELRQGRWLLCAEFSRVKTTGAPDAVLPLFYSRAFQLNWETRGSSGH